MFDLQNKLRQHFPYIAVTDIDSIIAGGKTMRLQAGQMLSASEGETKAVLVLKGIIRNCIHVSINKEITVSFSLTGQFISPSYGTLLGKPASEMSEAVTESVVFMMDAACIKQHATAYNALNNMDNYLLKYFLRLSAERVQQFILLSPEERYLYLLKDFGYLVNEVPLKYIASYLGVTHVSLSRIRKRISYKQKAIAA